MEGIHRLLAFLASAATVVGIVWSLVLVGARRPPGPRFEQFQAATVGTFLVGGASGGLLFLSGFRPSEGLHLLYAAIAVALIPLARSFIGRANDRRAVVLVLVAFVVLGGVTYRLFTTGGP